MKVIRLRPAAIYAAACIAHWLLLVLLFLAAAWLLFPALIIVAVICAAIAFYRFLFIRYTYYILNPETLQVRTGLLLRRTDHLEWFRVKDLVETQPLLLRPFGLMHLELLSNDKTNPVLRLSAVPADGLAEIIRERVQQARRNNPVFEIE